MAERTRRAIEACGRWLAECLRLGWDRSQIDALEALWWEHHDERGNLKDASGVAGIPPGPPEGAPPGPIDPPGGWPKKVA